LSNQTKKSNKSNKVIALNIGQSQNNPAAKEHFNGRKIDIKIAIDTRQASLGLSSRELNSTKRTRFTDITTDYNHINNGFNNHGLSKSVDLNKNYYGKKRKCLLMTN
jgi:hypothetical protein